VADYLRRNKPGSRVIVLDANPGIVAEQHTFTNAFNVTYAGTIEYYTNVTINEVNSDTRTVHTSIGSFTASVLNVIAEQQAGRLVRDAGLATDPTGRWAPVNVLSYATTAHADIHVIGDSQASTQPKSGHMASSQAKVCADAVLRGLVGLPPDPSPTTNSSCYSPISSKSASWLTASFQYNPASGGMAGVPAAAGEADKPSGGSYSEMFKWADNIFADSFI
jgi:NADH dehydrogenase FAD-containing subunit